MATINVRQLDDGVVATLKRRAAANHRSLEGEVRHILERVAANDTSTGRKNFLALADRLRRKTAGRRHTPAEVLIRADRDRDHDRNRRGA